jgi:hypothetical protein
MTERKGTDAPPFLKAAYIVIVLGCLTYLAVYMNGEVNHADRGVLVQQFNAATEGSDGFMWFVLALGVIMLVVLAKYAFSKVHED